MFFISSREGQVSVGRNYGKEARKTLSNKKSHRYLCIPVILLLRVKFKAFFLADFPL